MMIRFFTAVAIALSILAINVGASWAREPRSVVEASYRVVGQPTIARDRTVTLPQVVVRPSQAQLASIAAEGRTVRVASAVVGDAPALIAGHVRERVARVSLLVPYYAFGGARLRATE